VKSFGEVPPLVRTFSTFFIQSETAGRNSEAPLLPFFFAPGLKRFPKPSGLPPMAVVFFRSHTIELVVVSRL
jgi:hypothetical protein